MPVFSKGNFSVNLGFVSFGGDFDETDRQCAWELYCELITRVALVGKEDKEGQLVFTGEVLAESLESLHRFFLEARALMRRFPVGRLAPGRDPHHLGFFIGGLLEVVVRPFLEKWQALYRHWWAHQSDASLSPLERQERFPGMKEMREDWNQLRRFCRDSAAELAKRYALPDIAALSPPRLRQTWLDETQRLVSNPSAR